MKKYFLLKTSFVFLFSVFFISSCSIQKRSYNKGYFVQWNNQKGTTKAIKEVKSQDDLSENVLDSQHLNNEKVDNIDNIPTKIPDSLFLNESNIESIQIKKAILNSVNQDNTSFLEISKRIRNVGIKKQIEDKEPLNQTEKGGLIIHVLLMSGLVFILAVLIFGIRASSTNYINAAIIPAYLNFLVAFIILLVVIFYIFRWLFHKYRTKEKSSSEIKRKYRLFFWIEGGLVFIFLGILYLASILL